MVESELILLGTETDDSGIPWALLAREQDGELQFAARQSSGTITCQRRMGHEGCGNGNQAGHSMA